MDATATATAAAPRAAADAAPHEGHARLGTVPVFVADQERALAFWRDAMGWEVTADFPIGNGDRWLAVARRRGETEVLLFRPGMYGPDSAPLADRVGAWTGMVFLTGDIQAAYRELSERGVPFGGPPRQQPWGGWETWFSDPDGNRFQLAERPAWMQ